MLLLAKSVESDELDHGPFAKNKRINALMKAIDEYYANAFAPEIIYALDLVENSKTAAELITKYLKLIGEKTVSTSFHESKFHVNLLYIQNQFEKALYDIKIKKNHVLFIDGIDIRPGVIPYKDYLECVKGLANAVWSLNNDFFPKIRDSKGRFRTVLLLRPDIFNTLGLQNQTNKVRDNSVFLDWRTTYPEYSNSSIFELSDKLLAAQQNTELKLGEAWNYYFPWQSRPTSPERFFDPSFFKFLRLSYS
ncbi:MAG: funZ protein, partial [Spirochaetes bacterium]|nr:funZ protein [Spirochaetota bacterium]